MANKYQGETEIEINGETKTLVFDMNALAELEEKFDVDIDKLMTIIERGMSIKKLRTFLWAGLLHEYTDENGEWKDPENPLREKTVGAWIGRSTTPMRPVIEKMSEALRIAMGVDEDEVKNAKAITKPGVTTKAKATKK